ncbi:structural maintenance of chromosomes domain-containing protein [Striga asiatica]|uniref:Structural maintenance of chromosomes domain-containing protein n=1 Tax=Striga asiatica TaxID=4170 RepID=A0A5A7PJ13_STRAF|nr:structural maintenance of chromosomes domain-containing protein [Striga asiatica]
MVKINLQYASAHVAIKQDAAAERHQPPPPSGRVATPNREVYDHSHKIEVEARSLDRLATDLNHTRVAIDELRSERNGRMENLMGIQLGREAIELVREMHATNFQIGRAMEKHMVAMTREAEKLCYELANAERRAMAMVAILGLNRVLDSICRY